MGPLNICAVGRLIDGATPAGIFPLHTMDDSFAVDRYVREADCKRAVIIGSGYIGLEMADALTLRGPPVTVFGRSASAVPTADGLLRRLVEEELRRHGVVLQNGAAVSAIEHVPDVSGQCLTRHPGLP